WTGVYAKPAPPVPLPAYPYQRQRYWIDRRPKAAASASRDFSGIRLRSPSLRGIVFETQLSLSAFPYLADHKIQGSVLLPMTAFLELAINAVAKSGHGQRALTDVTVLSPLTLPAEGACTVQVIVEDDAVKIFSLAGDEWKLHASCGCSAPATQNETA